MAFRASQADLGGNGACRRWNARWAYVFEGQGHGNGRGRRGQGFSGGVVGPVLELSHRRVPGRRSRPRHASVRIDVDSPDVAELLEAWDGPTYAWEDEDGVELILVRPTAAPERPRWLLYISLFVATTFTTLTAGALLFAGTRWPRRGSSWGCLASAADTVNVGDLLLGAPVRAHASRYPPRARAGSLLRRPSSPNPCDASVLHSVSPVLSIVGTLGAFIRLKGPIVHRLILLDIGASVP